MSISIVQLVLVVFLLAALLRAPVENKGRHVALGYLIVIGVLTYVLVTGALR